MMSENYKIISKFIKDISGETPDVETYLYVKDYISKYQMNIEIKSKAFSNSFPGEPPIFITEMIHASAG